MHADLHPLHGCCCVCADLHPCNMDIVCEARFTSICADLYPCTWILCVQIYILAVAEHDSVQINLRANTYLHGCCCSSVLPGPYSFRVELPHSEAKQVIKEENLLVINKGVYFAVFFHWDSPPPEDSVISALVLCADSNDFERFGPVVRCKNHLQEDGSKETGIDEHM